ncbi:MAG: SDR family oxidoreductase, partial [Rhodobacteraceae bacterium]|nr:SDR family oxidoreductase [Paracoccaceae bacterium]
VEPLPFRRASTPTEQADMIVFAASNRCSYVSGTILTVDAGISQRGHIF